MAIRESSDPAGAGDPLIYTLTVTNAGPATANNIVLTNWLPTGVTFVTASTTLGSWSQNAGVVRCNFGTLTVGTTATVSVSVIPPTPGLFTNVCTVSSTAPDVNGFNNTATEVTTAALAVSISDATVTEGDTGTTNAVFTVRLSAPGTQTITASYRTILDTADGTDLNMASGFVTFAPGTTNQPIVIAVRGDTFRETNEQFFIELYNPVNAILGRARGSGTILDDETMVPALSISDTSVVEGNSGMIEAQFTISLSAPVGNMVWFDFATSDGTAKAMEGDYSSTGGNWFILPGSTNATLRVNVFGDTLPEPNETFFVTITSTSAPVTRAVGTCVILDDEPPLPPLIVAASTVLLSESYTPTNGYIDPGETVTANVALQNLGGGNPSITATLLSTGGVSSISGPQNYGVLSSGAAAVPRPFTFTANGACGSMLNAVLRLESGGTNFATITNQIVLGHPILVLAQNFDSTNSIPSGWANGAGSGFQWMIGGIFSHSPPNTVFIIDPPFPTDRPLLSPPLAISTASAQLAFLHRRVLGTGSGGVLEIAIGDDSFTDILAAGGSFVSGGYTHTMSNATALAGRMAWSGTVAGFVRTLVNLPPSAAGQSVRLSWRFVSNGQGAMSGWYVDTVSVTEAICSAPSLRILSPVKLGGQFHFCFESATGKTYWVDATDSLTSTNWQPVQSIPGDGSQKMVTNSIPASGQRFYRLRVP
ncbi:MAG: DUF11 domain-containing protein [Verrucomicrobia bacterium]|nr:DUF11 domain-containing protein [Verrucomicrobiota bacterium]